VESRDVSATAKCSELPRPLGTARWFPRVERGHRYAATRPFRGAPSHGVEASSPLKCRWVRGVRSSGGPSEPRARAPSDALPAPGQSTDGAEGEAWTTW